jgi:hypothetical protein
MSKRRTKKKANYIPLIVVAVGGLLLLVTAIVLGMQSKNPGGGTPVLAVDQKVIDYGDVNFNVEKTFTIKVTNTGDGTLRFLEEPYIQVLEGC